MNFLTVIFFPLFQCGWMWWYRWWIWGTTPHLLSTILKTSSPTAHKADQYTANSFLLCLMLSILHQTTCPIMFDRSYFLSVPPLGFVYFKFLSSLCSLFVVECRWSQCTCEMYSVAILLQSMSREICCWKFCKKYTMSVVLYESTVCRIVKKYEWQGQLTRVPKNFPPVGASKWGVKSHT
jgi:hypothetical protein